MNFLLQILTCNKIAAITLFPFGIYLSPEYYISVNSLIRIHESIHRKQQKEMFFLGIIISTISTIILIMNSVFLWWIFLLLAIFPFLFFYIWYVIEWFLKLILPPFTQAYYRISFEKEAYNNTYNNYLINRKNFAWLKYVFKK